MPEWAGPLLLASVWAVFYVWRAWRAHAGLLTNAYDLSLFDYTLWSTLEGRPGFVPFMHSIFSHHFMPIILLVTPIYAIWPSPEWLIVIQTVALAGASLLFYAIARRIGLGRWPALALMLASLISRRSHSGAVTYFYFESLQPLLMFTMVLAWMQGRRWLFWTAVALLLTTKEDMPLYLIAFAALGSGLELPYGGNSGYRRTAIQDLTPRTLAIVSAVWFIAAFMVFIPLARSLEGQSTTNPFFEGRFGPIGTGLSAATIIAGRVLSVESVKTLFSILAAAGFISLAAPRLLLVAAPAVLICLGLAPGNTQTYVLGHYALPVMPWVFLSAAGGLVWVTKRSPTAARVFVVLLFAATLIDAPVIRHGGKNAINPDATAVLGQLPPLEVASSPCSRT